LYATTAVIEIGTALALLCSPSAVVDILLGAPLDASAALAVARIAGVALLALGVACGLARDDAQNPTARGLVAAMLLYNLGVALILAAAGIQSAPLGVVLWPAAVALHAAMAVWCIVNIVRRRTGDETPTSSALSLRKRQDR
jgi:tellurite resistance protein TehA-like permease